MKTLQKWAEENDQHLKKNKNAQPLNKVFIHASGDDSRHGFTAIILKRLYSPYNGFSFQELVDTLGEEFSEEAEEKINEDPFSELFKKREDIIKSLPTRLFAKDRPVVSHAYYRFAGGRAPADKTKNDARLHIFSDG